MNFKDDQFTQLFKYMQREFAKIDATHTELKMDIHRIYKILDKDLKQQETDEQERLAMGRQLTRHDRWIGQIADHTKVKLVPGRTAHWAS